jgi:hypothetical protein
MALSTALTKPLCSATPTPSRATSTTPSGWKPVKVWTMSERNVAIAGPVSWLTTSRATGPAFDGTSKLVPASNAEAIHTNTRASTKSAAGSGRALPARSTRSSSLPPLPGGVGLGVGAGVAVVVTAGECRNARRSAATEVAATVPRSPAVSGSLASGRRPAYPESWPRRPPFRALVPTRSPGCGMTPRSCPTPARCSTGRCTPCPGTTASVRARPPATACPTTTPA